jgi:hypothetical protein
MKYLKLSAKYDLMARMLVLEGQDLYTVDTTKNHLLGTQAWGVGGRIYRYALVGTSALVKGNLLQEAVNDTQFNGLAVQTAGVVNDTSLTLTNGTTTIVPQLFQDGSVFSYTAGSGIAIGDHYNIVGNITGTLTTGGTIKVPLDRPLRYAYPTTTTAVNLAKSPYGGVIQAPATTQTGIAVGVAIYELAASTSTVWQYGWIQTHGECAVLSDGSSFAIGSDVGTPSGTAGCVTVFAAGTTHMRVGTARQAASSSHTISVFLQID